MYKDSLLDKFLHHTRYQTQKQYDLISIPILALELQEYQDFDTFVHH